MPIPDPNRHQDAGAGPLRPDKSSADGANAAVAHARRTSQALRATGVPNPTPPSDSSLATGDALATGSPLPTGQEKVRLVRHMFDTIAPRYESINRVMSLGLDRAWRRQCVASLELAPGSKVLDVACGTGDLSRVLSASAMRPVGLDLSPGMLSFAGKKLPLVLADALRAPFANASFDGAVSGFALRNVVDLSALFAELARLVRPGGRIALLDMAEPDNRLLRLGHTIWAKKVVPLIGSALSDSTAYHYLPRSLEYLPPPATMIRWLEEAGFRAVQRRPMALGATQLYVATLAGGDR